MTGFRIDEDLYRFAQEYAKKHYRSVTSLVNEFFDSLKKKAEEEKKNQEQR